MRQLIAIAGLLLLLAACDHADEDKAALAAQAKEDADNISANTEHNTMRVANTMRDNIKRTGDRIRSWWITPLPENKRLAVKDSYCYSVYQDIVCYRQPMPGWEHRLIGYQGTNAAPPPPATTQPLVMQTVDAKQLPQNRVANAQPVFNEMPADIKEDKNKAQTPADEVPAAEPAHETLPDPALASQL